MVEVKAHRRVPLDKGASRGNPTKEGEQAGVAARLVTFLWPRKEKSLAQPRSGGETPSRTASSRPAWRSHADTVLPDKDVTRPLTLSRKGRGNNDRGRLRCANRPYWFRGWWVTPAEDGVLAPRRRCRSPAGLHQGRYRLAVAARVRREPSSGVWGHQIQPHLTEPSRSYPWL